MSKPTITIRDVANHASVSPSTVSLVLRDADSVHPRTRRQVEQAIGELGYRRRPVGRPARESRGHNIAIVYPARAIFLPPKQQTTATLQWFLAIQEELRMHGHHLNFFGGQDRVASDPLFREIAQRDQIDGVIFLAIDTEHEDLAWSIQQDLPVVAINRHAPRGEFSSVEVDNYGAGRVVVDYLTELGHRRIAMAPAPQARGKPFNWDRRDGFAAAMKARELEPIWIHRHPATHPDGDAETACQQALEQQATALFCDGDGLAVRCVNYLQSRGIDVPGQMSIIGFDNRDMVAASGQQVTSVGFDNRMVGQCTAEMIHKLILRRPGLVNMTARVRTVIAEHDTAGWFNPAPSASSRQSTQEATT